MSKFDPSDIGSIKEKLGKFKDIAKMLPELENIMGKIEGMDLKGMADLTESISSPPEEVEAKVIEDVVESKEPEEEGNTLPDYILHKEVLSGVLDQVFKNEPTKVVDTRPKTGECMFNCGNFFISCTPYYCTFDLHTKSSVNVIHETEPNLSTSYCETITSVVNHVLGMVNKGFLQLNKGE